MAIDSDENVKAQTLKLFYGLLLVCCIGGAFYLFGLPVIGFINEAFNVALTATDMQIAFCIVVVVSVKALWVKIDKKMGVGRAKS